MEIVGSLLFLGRCTKNNLLTELSNLTAIQAKGTKPTKEAAKKFLNYCATNLNPTIRFQGIQMALNLHSDASCLSEAKARSWVGGHF